MTITAKYRSWCQACSQRINAGDRIDWTKGQRPRHARCAVIAGAPARIPGYTADRAAEAIARAVEPSPEIARDVGARVHSSEPDRCPFYLGINSARCSQPAGHRGLCSAARVAPPTVVAPPADDDNDATSNRFKMLEVEW